ncbi:MAG: OmpA family protein [Terriglobales bacterium]
MQNGTKFRNRAGLIFLMLATILTLTSTLALAQERVPQAEVFIGYSWLDPCPCDRIPASPPVDGVFTTTSVQSINAGWEGGVTWNFTKNLGLEVDYGHHYGNQINEGIALIGPRVTFTRGRFAPWAHVKAGTARMAIANFPDDKPYGFATEMGGGVDAWFKDWLGVRLIEVDYLYQAHKLNSYVGNTNGVGFASVDFNGVSIDAGLLFGLGHLKPPVPPTAACFLQPTRMMAGDPATASVDARNFDPKHTLTYDWKTTGGEIAGKGQTADINTTGLGAGSYTVTATVTDPKLKNYNMATCNASFEIQEAPKHPPTICCTGNQTVHAGETATINCQASSPDNRPLKFDWRANGGRIAGNGATATLDTTGAPAGPISITTTVADDRGLTATGTTTVTVTEGMAAGAAPTTPQVSNIGEIAFPNKKKPSRVDNTDKAILDDIALRLQHEPDAKIVIVGYFDPAESGGDEVAKHRAVNTKAYLTNEKGIDPTRIEVRTGTAGGNRAEVFLVPAGATYNGPGTETFDESAVKAQPRNPGAAAHHKSSSHHKAKAKAGAEAAPAANAPAAPDATPAPAPQP